jgi:hypothetical protein
MYEFPFFSEIIPKTNRNTALEVSKMAALKPCTITFFSIGVTLSNMGPVERLLMMVSGNPAKRMHT